MKNFFLGIAHFFKSLFGDNGATVQKVLHDVSGFVGIAEPIIQEIEVEVKAIIQAGDHNATLTSMLNFLGKYEPDFNKAKQIADTLSGLPVADILHNLAVLALSTIVPAGTASSLIRMAVELAYNVFKAKKAAVAAA
jgi:hypothetical protein